MSVAEPHKNVLIRFAHDAAWMLLAVLLDSIHTAYLNHAKQIGYSIERVLEMALADFLDPDLLTFADCKPQIGVLPNDNPDE